MGLGAPELLVIFVIALLVFGPKKLPELGKSLGTGIREFKKASNELQRTLEEEVRLDDQKQRTSPPAPLMIESSPETIHSSAKAAIDAAAPPTPPTIDVVPATPTAANGPADSVARGSHGA